MITSPTVLRLTTVVNRQNSPFLNSLNNVQDNWSTLELSKDELQNMFISSDVSTISFSNNYTIQTTITARRLSSVQALQGISKTKNNFLEILKFACKYYKDFLNAESTEE